MNFIRPSVITHFRRWRESYGVGIVVLLGAWLALKGYLITSPIYIGVGVLIILVTLGILRTVILRTRFGQEAKAPGLVEVKERQISYFGTMVGKSVSLDDVTKIELRESEAYSAIWVLHSMDADPMIVPISAKGSQMLFDAFASLPRVRLDDLVAAVNRSPIQRHVIWEKVKPSIRA